MRGVMYYWAVLLFYCGIPLCVVSYIHTLRLRA